MFVCCECCVLSGRGLCDELITCPEESYRLRCVVVCDLETSRMRRPWPALGCSPTEKKVCKPVGSGADEYFTFHCSAIWCRVRGYRRFEGANWLHVQVSPVNWFLNYRGDGSALLPYADTSICTNTHGVISTIQKDSFFFFFFIPTSFYLHIEGIEGYCCTCKHSGHTTLDRIPLDEWSAHRRDLCLKARITHKRQASMPPAGFEPAIPSREQPQAHAPDRAITGAIWIFFVC